MNASKPNQYGCSHYAYVSDMSGQDDLRTQLKNAGIEIKETELSMGTLFAEPALFVSYTRKSGESMTVLIIPMMGADSWCEEYYYFPGLDHPDALKVDWRAFVQDRYCVSEFLSKNL